MFGNAQGILGLAYTRLNMAYEMPGPTIPPKYTFNEIQSGRVTYPEPYFTQLEAAGLVANKFAFYALRSEVNMATASPADDPLNKGVVILGGGEESTDLFKGTFQVARIVDDQYYNTNLKAVIVGKGADHSAPADKSQREYVQLDRGQRHQQPHARPAPLQSDSEAAFSVRRRVPLGFVAGRLCGDEPAHLEEWPTLTFVLEGALGTDVRLEVPPETYWQTNSQRAGQATAVLYGDEGAGKGQSILGLPLLNRYFTIFDRSVDRGFGVISFAPIKL